MAYHVTPGYIGADEVDIQGATHVDLKMGTLDLNCYQITLGKYCFTSYPFDLFYF